jgi:sulfide:quinone oxidoreductase
LTRVLISGGGVAGVEALLGLSTLAEGRVEVELLSPTEEFVYRPLLVAEPFGAAEVLRLDLKDVAADAGARYRKDALASVDPAARTIKTASGTTLEYEALLIAHGATPVEAVPGALAFSGEAQRRSFAELLRKLGRRSTRRLAFVVPRAANWSIAAYELALLTAAERDARALTAVELTVVTHEAAPLDLFGPAGSQLVAARLEQAGVSVRASCRAQRFEDGRLQLDGGDSLDFDAAVALPALEVPPCPGIPQGHGGFVQVDVGMNVAGLVSVWAAGDATAFPIKQGGLAAQQADAAARSIAVRAGAEVPIEPFQPVLRAMLITGGAPQFLRASIAERARGVAATGQELWTPAAKVAGKYLGPYLARELGAASSPALLDIDPSADPDVEEAGHERGVSLILTAADADARIGDFEAAIRWLSLVERLNLVIPAPYVARRDQWRRQLGAGAEPDTAAERIDPSLAGAAAALDDLRRRMAWLREIERNRGGEMRDDLATLDDDLDHLIALSKQTGILRPRSAR